MLFSSSRTNRKYRNKKKIYQREQLNLKMDDKSACRKFSGQANLTPEQKLSINDINDNEIIYTGYLMKTDSRYTLSNSLNLLALKMVHTFGVVYCRS